MERMTYAPPTVETHDVDVEQGFAGSVTAEAQVEGFNRDEWNE